MSDLTNVFTNIADAIRNKANTVNTFKPTEMANAINNISTGVSAFVVDNTSVASSFNMPVIISNGTTSLYDCFRGFFNFNQPINIPESVVNMSYCFDNCRKFNQAIIIPNHVTSLSYCFQNCVKFNRPMTALPNSVTSMLYCFRNCQNFNAPIVLPNSVNTIASCFHTCTNFNQQLTIPENVDNMDNCFLGCSNFNRRVRFTNAQANVSMFQCFMNCTNLDYETVQIPMLTTSLAYCFANCLKFNKGLSLTVGNMAYCFDNCRSYNLQFRFSTPPNSVAFCFRNCVNMAQNIYIKVTPSTNVRGMLNLKNTSLKINVHTNNPSKFIGNASTNSITATPITWTAYGTGNYYNATYNINIINNQSM